MPTDEEEQTGIDYKYHFITLVYLVIAVLALTAFGMIYPYHDNETAGRIGGTTIAMITAIRYLW